MNGLDLKLAARMLVKYPGLTVVGGLAMAFAIWVGVVTFAMVTPFVYPSLPLPAAERVIKIENWDTATNNEDSRILHDFGIWRDSLRSITEIGVWRDSPRNVMIDDGDPRQVYAAEISASGFRVASAAPLLGRVLVDADEQPQAPWVAVIGYDLWQTRFGSDPNVLGREVKIGTDVATIVGVMRDGFAFPVAHEFWLPFRRVLDPRRRHSVSLLRVKLSKRRRRSWAQSGVAPQRRAPRHTSTSSRESRRMPTR
jgi:putative ABC transport system permease protein